MTRTQTFVEPVPDLVEDLSAAGKYASEKSVGSLLITLTIHYLGVHIAARRVGYLIREAVRFVPWPEIAQARMNMLIPAIDLVIEELNK